MQLRAGENKWIYFPVVPIIETGEITIKFTAYSFLRIDTEEVTVEIVVRYAFLVMCFFSYLNHILH